MYILVLGKGYQIEHTGTRNRKCFVKCVIIIAIPSHYNQLSKRGFKDFEDLL